MVRQAHQPSQVPEPVEGLPTVYCLLHSTQSIRPACRMLVGEALAHVFEVLDVILALVVAVRPIEGMEMPILEVERRFYENPALHVDALALVLGRCQKELPECHVARIEIHGAQPRRAVFLGDFKFNVVCPKLDIDNRFAVYELLVAEERTHRRYANFFFVVIGEREWEWFQVQVFFAETGFENTANRIHGFGIFRENAHDNFHFGRSSNFTHGRKFSKRRVPRQNIYVLTWPSRTKCVSKNANLEKVLKVTRHSPKENPLILVADASFFVFLAL